MKSVVWLGDSRARLREFPADAMRVAGHELEQVQAGREPTDWKPMPSVGLGVAEAVYVLHAFQKKSRKTAHADIELARRRFRALIEERRRR